MAKGKQQELTLEEKLEQALAPEDEQPYEVPGNWVWVRLGGIANFIGGGTPSKSVAAYWNGDIPWASVKDIKGDYLTETIDKITSDGLMNSASNICDINELILVTRIEPGKTIISKIQTAINQDLKIVKSKLPSKYLHYFFINNRQEFARLSSGSTVLGITLDNIVLFKVPLPPIAEQQRIVDRIESLFAKLDQAKELAQNALDTFETRKAAILHKAFTGELTVKWREKNGVGMESWEMKSLTEICTLKSGTTIPVEQELPTGKIPYVKVADMNHPENTFAITISSRFVDEYKENQLIPRGSIIFPKRGGAIFTNKKRIVMVSSILADLNIMAIIPNGQLIDSLYCYYWFLTIDLKQLNNGSNVPQINNKDMVPLVIPTPSLPEQREIVRILGSLFEKEQKAKELCDVIDKIDLMKKAILARAFRGELGTNGPSEESAMELLKECLK